MAFAFRFEYFSFFIQWGELLEQRTTYRLTYFVKVDSANYS